MKNEVSTEKRRRKRGGSKAIVIKIVQNSSDNDSRSSDEARLSEMPQVVKPDNQSVTVKFEPTRDNRKAGRIEVSGTKKATGKHSKRVSFNEEENSIFCSDTISGSFGAMQPFLTDTFQESAQLDSSFLTVEELPSVSAPNTPGNSPILMETTSISVGVGSVRSAQPKPSIIEESLGKKLENEKEESGNKVKILVERLAQLIEVSRAPKDPFEPGLNYYTRQYERAVQIAEKPASSPERGRLQSLIQQRVNQYNSLSSTQGQSSHLDTIRRGIVQEVISKNFSSQRSVLIKKSSIEKILIPERSIRFADALKVFER